MKELILPVEQDVLPVSEVGGKQHRAQQMGWDHHCVELLPSDIVVRPEFIEIVGAAYSIIYVNVIGEPPLRMKNLLHRKVKGASTKQLMARLR